MPVALNNVLRVDVRGDFDTTEDLVNVYQFRVDAITDPSDTAVLNDFSVYMRAGYAAMAGLWAANIVWRGVRIANLTTDTLVGEINFTTNVVGTASGDQGAIQAAGLLSLKTNVPRVVMRKYFPVAESSIDGTSRLTTAASNLIATWGTNLLGGFVGASNNDYQFGYLSPKTSSFVVPTTRVVSPIIATQRRRRPGVGS